MNELINISYDKAAYFDIIEKLAAEKQAVE